VREIEEALEGCDVMVVLSSTATWQPERWVRREVLFATERRKPIIPVLLEGALPLDLIDRQFVDGRVDIDDLALDLLEAIRAVIHPDVTRADVDRLLGAAMRARLGRDGARAAERYQQALQLDPTLPKASEVWSEIARSHVAPAAVTLDEIVLVERTVKLDQSPYKDGRQAYRWSLHLDAPSEVLEEISAVVYDLSAFYAKTGERTVRDRRSGFQLSMAAWGPMFFPVRILLRDGSTLETWIDLLLKDHEFPAPTEPFPL
jgi:hypothetical protein